MLLTVAATAFTFTACNDDNDGDGKKPFESDLIGAYVPAMQPEDTQGIYGDIFITPTWKGSRKCTESGSVRNFPAAGRNRCIAYAYEFHDSDDVCRRSGSLRFQ